MRLRIVTLSLVVLGLAFPAASLAVGTNQNVTGAAASTLTISSTAASLGAFAYGTDGTGSSTTSIGSTKSATWTVALSDSTDATTPGRMDKLTGTTGPTCSGGSYAAQQNALVNALVWAPGTVTATNGGTVTADAGGTRALAALGSSAATGTKNATVVVDYTQSITQTEPLTENDCYRLSTTYTVS